MPKQIGDLIVEQNRKECERLICDGINRSYFDSNVFSYAVQLIRTNLIQNITECIASVIIESNEGSDTTRVNAELKEWTDIAAALSEPLPALAIAQEAMELVHHYGNEDGNNG